MNINDSNIRPELTFRRLVFLHMQQLTNFPYIEQDFDALTDYELLCLVVKYLNDVIANSNEQNTSITNLYNAFLQLQTYMNNSVQELEDAWTDKTNELENEWNDKTTELETAFNNLQTWINNYFDNLDVQDEINNKLDEMLEDGVLEQIIEQFLQSTALWCFDTVNDMKQATNLINGSFVQTLGFYSKNDGGKSIYKVRSKTSNDIVDNSLLIQLLDTSLVAELIIDNEIYVEQLGVKGDGSTDDTDNINKALSSGASIINFSKGKTYMVRGYELSDSSTDATGLNVQSNTTINLNYSTLKVIPNNREYYKILFLNTKENVLIKNGFLLGDINDHDGTTGEWGHGLCIKDSHNIVVENITSSYFWGDGFNIQGDTSNYFITFENCIADNNRRQGLSVSTELHDSYFNNCTFMNTGKTSKTAPAAGVDLEPELSKRCYNITFYNCTMRGNQGSAIHVRDCNNINFDSCLFEKNEGDYAERIFYVTDTSYDIKLNNCTIDQVDIDRNINQIDASGNIYLNGVIFKNSILMLRLHNSNINNIYLNRCEFDLSIQYPWNSCITLLTTSYAQADTGSRVVIENSFFNYTATTGDLREWIGVQNNSYFNLIEISNSTFSRGKVAIADTYVNTYLKNNTFIQISKQTMNLSGATNTHVFINNLFEQCNYDSSAVSLINNDAATNYILKDNTTTNHTINKKIDIVSPSHSATQFIQTTSTASLHVDVNNTVANI